MIESDAEKESSCKPFKYGSFVIRACKKDKQAWICMKDIGDVIGMPKYHDYLTHIDKKEFCHIQTRPNMVQRLAPIFVTEKVIANILGRTKKTVTREFLYWLKDTFNFSSKILQPLYKGRDNLIAICTVFKHENIWIQYKLGEYIADLYFPDHKLALFEYRIEEEIDEKREEHFKQELDCGTYRIISKSIDIIGVISDLLDIFRLMSVVT